MQHKPTPLADEVRARLLKSGVAEDALPAVMSHLEREGYLDLNEPATRVEQVRFAVDGGVRQFSVLMIDRAGRQETSQGSTRSLKPPPRRGVPASVRLQRLAQRLMIEKLSGHPRVRDWRREHLGRANQVLTWDEADQWVIDNTEPRTEESTQWIYWSVPGDAIERTVPPGGPMASLQELSEFLKEETGWQDRDAMMWVLMDKPPPISQIRVRTRLRRYDISPTVILEASVWASDRFVAQQFRAAKSIWMSRRPAAKQKVIDMANFRLDHPDLSWEDCWRGWNEANPATQYTTAATMKRSYFGLMKSLRQLRTDNPQAARRRLAVKSTRMRKGEES